MYFHTITMFHDLILEHTEEIANTEEYLAKNTSYLNIQFSPQLIKKIES